MEEGCSGELLMSWTYNFGSNPSVAYVRLLISDTDPTTPVFQDEEILAFIQIQCAQFQSAQFYSPPAGQNLPQTLPNIPYLRVAALAIDSMAVNAGKLAVISRLLDVELDAKNAASFLQSQAKSLRDLDDNSGAFFIVEQVNNDWSLYQRYWNQVARQQGIPF